MSSKVFWGILVIIMVGFGFLYNTQKKPGTSIRSGDVKTIEGVKEFDKLENKHAEGNLPYPQSPPVGGNHNPTWIACDQKSYDNEVQKEKAVHAMEHGAVWISHMPTLDKAKIDALKEKVKTSGATFLTPFSQQTSPIVISAWGAQLEVADSNDPRIDQFLVKYRKSAKAPEPGATCASSEGPGTALPPSAGSAMPQGGGSAPPGSGGLAPGETQEQHDKESQQQPQ